ncbi:hypothetical protein [Liquorilactobacillus nagelii]|uniref:hypothetical protein n=1 Tax=Liquorilactobacillus nagelii TaxID=82688 RepID=UPI0039E952AE
MKTREELFNRIWQMGLGNGTIDDDEIQGILNLPTQEQLDCPYCHDPFLDLSGVADDELDTGGDSYCSIDENGNMIYGSFSEGYDVSCNEMPIKFCPMCGRKLGDE